MLKRINQLKYKKIIISLIVILILFGVGSVLLENNFVQAQTSNLAPVATHGNTTAAKATKSNKDDTASSNGASIVAGYSSDLGQWVAQFLTWIMTIFISFVGAILTEFIGLLIWVVKFNQFIDTRAVSIGWTMVRDLANIFFVIIMLLIAVGTLFNMQSYEYKKLLPKLMLAVILVNFSKMIVGLAIDVGQVIMLTFVNAFSASGAGAIVSGLKLEKMFQLKELVEDSGGKEAINYWTLFGTACLALIMLIIASVVILQLVVVLLARIIMLWVLVIFSPIAFVASVLPNSPLQKVGFFGQYWTYLSKYIIIGPILAFFLWLSFSIMNVENEKHAIDLKIIKSGKGSSAYFGSKVSDPQSIFDYMTTIALLIASLMISQQMGVIGGKMGMNAVNKMKNKVGEKVSNWAKNRKEGITGKLDRISIGAQAGLGKTGFGKSKFARMIGLDKPKSFRKKYRQEAKDAHKQRVEDAVMKKHGVVGAMEDRLNRGVFNWKDDETNKQQLERDRHVAEKRKELQDSSRGKSEPGVAYSFKNAKTDEEKEAAIYELIKTHGLNNLTDGRSTSSQAVKKLVVDTFGDGEEGMRVMENIQEMSVDNKDPQLYGTVKTNIETGKREWTSPEEQAEAAAEQQGKKTGYKQIDSLTMDAYEVKDGELTLGAGKMFKVTATQLGKNYNRIGHREQEHFSNNVEAFKKFADQQAPEDKKAMYQAISRMINPNGKGEELFNGNNLNNDIVGGTRADEIIKQYKAGGTTTKKEVNHEEEVVKKEKTIEENEEKIKTAKSEQDIAKDEKNKMSKEQFGSRTSKYKEQEVIENSKKQEIENLEAENQRIRNQIQSEHKPAVAEQVVDSLNKEDLGNAVDMQQVGEKLAEAVDDALKNIDSGLDFTEATKGLDNFTDNLNEELDKIKDDNKKPDLSFANVNNMNKANDSVVQINMLRKLGEIAKKLGKKAGDEE